jgi:hypothetical protein
MDHADALIGQDEATRYSLIQHHVVNGRDSLFPVADEDNGKGKPKLGKASWSKHLFSTAWSHT